MLGESVFERVKTSGLYSFSERSEAVYYLNKSAIFRTFICIYAKKAVPLQADL